MNVKFVFLILNIFKLIFDTGIMFAKVPVTKASSAFKTSFNLNFFSNILILFSLQILIMLFLGNLYCTKRYPLP